MTIQFFKNVETLEQLKKQYRTLAKKHHPDLADNKEEATKTMKAINKEYEILFEQLKTNDKHSKNENVNTFKDIINELIKHDITIDIVGSWLWVYGQGTFNIKDTLKKIGFRWSKSKKKWYFFEGIKETKKKRGRKSYKEIINEYGRVTLKVGNDNSDNKNKKQLLTD